MTLEELEFDGTSPTREEDEVEDEDSGPGTKIDYSPMRSLRHHQTIRMRALNVEKWVIMHGIVPSVEETPTKPTNSTHALQWSKKV